MKVLPTAIPEVLVVEPTIFGDGRGFFMEAFSQRGFNAAVGTELTFVQDNHSRSSKGVLRGLHYQLPPCAQGKLVRVTNGAVFDVAADMRRSSPTFGRWTAQTLSADNHLQMWIPQGFAHGFLVLSESADFLYKTTDYYAPELEAAVRWDDPALAIKWPDIGMPPKVSEKDARAPSLAGACTFS
jgi:dTDP-4-dehydrorhamnose 3,5-epimerase